MTSRAHGSRQIEVACFGECLLRFVFVADMSVGDDVYATRARGRLSVSGPSKGAKIVVGMKLTTASQPWQLPECAIEPAPPS
ncbi:MAG: hypothetical protein ABIR10_02165 [Dokdonella sp.]